jgi:hypothetical protein
MIKKQAVKSIKGQQLQKRINQAIKSLDEHWVYDAVALFSDCAVAITRISRLLNQLKTRPNKAIGREREILKEVGECVQFIREWKSVANEHFIAPLACPDEVEFRLQSLREAANLSARERARMRRRETTEDMLRSLDGQIGHR